MNEISLEKSVEKVWGLPKGFVRNSAYSTNSDSEMYEIPTQHDQVSLSYSDQDHVANLRMYREIVRKSFEDELVDEFLLIGNRRIFFEKAGYNTEDQEMTIDRRPDCVRVIYTFGIPVQEQTQLDRLCEILDKCLIAEAQR